MITRKYGMAELQPDTVTVRLRGTAGQSLGAFAVRGIKLEVLGDANDYVGKGLSGGTIVVKPTVSSKLVPELNAIIGNTASTAPPPASCSPRAAPASASPSGTPAPTRWSRRGLERLRIHDRRHRGDPGVDRRQLRRRHDGRHGLRLRPGESVRAQGQSRDR